MQPNRFVEAHNSLNGGYRDALDRRREFTHHWCVVHRSGFCQAGWDALKKARGILKTPKIRAANARRKDCAIRDVAVVVLRDAAQNAASGVHVETILGEQLAATGAAHAESQPYAAVKSAIRLRNRDVRPGRNVFAHPSTRAFERLVLPRVSSVDIGRSGWTRSHRQATANMWDRCAEGPGLCEVQ